MTVIIIMTYLAFIFVHFCYINHTFAMLVLRGNYFVYTVKESKFSWEEQIRRHIYRFDQLIKINVLDVLDTLTKMCQVSKKCLVIDVM